jgi:hypothetical protein
LELNFFQKSLSHQKKYYYFIVLNKICLYFFDNWVIFRETNLMSLINS